MSKALSAIKNGIIDENPTFIQVLGTCPTLAVTTSAINGIGMGLSTMAVLVCSNLFISLLRKIIPDTVRIPCFIVVIASFVTIVQLLLTAFLPALNESVCTFHLSLLTVSFSDVPKRLLQRTDRLHRFATVSVTDSDLQLLFASSDLYESSSEQEHCLV